MNICSALEKYEARNFELKNFREAFDFPFKAVLPYDSPKESLESRQKVQTLFAKQFCALYSHCQKFDEKDPGNPTVFENTVSYIMDLGKKWVPLGRLGHIKFISVTQSVIQFSNMVLRRQDWIFDISELNSGSALKHKFSLFNKEIISLSHLPLVYFDGNECEKITYPKNPELSNSDWDGWKEEMPTAISTYRESIYFLFREAILGICNTSYREEISLVDIGGGDAELALPILEHRKILSYTVIERNEKSADLALQRATCDCPFYTQGKRKLQVIKADATQIDFSKILNKALVDIIVLSGVVADQVLSRRDSETLLRKCKMILNFSGVILVASHSAAHFNSGDYKKMGFNILNKTASFYTDEQTHTESFYVLSNA